MNKGYVCCNSTNMIYQVNVEKDFQLQFQNTFEHTMQEFVLSVNEPSKPRVKDQNWKNRLYNAENKFDKLFV